MDADQTRQLLNIASTHLEELVGKINFDDGLPDQAINSISLIIRTLDKISQLEKLLPDGAEGQEGALSKDEQNKLRDKAKLVISKVIEREKIRESGLKANECKATD